MPLSGSAPDLLEEALWMGQLATHAARVWRAVSSNDVEIIPLVVAEFREIEQKAGLEENWDC